MYLRFLIFLKCLIHRRNIALLTLFCAPVYAVVDGTSDFRINGFGSLSLARADNARLGSRNSISQDGVFDGWSAGLNSNLGIQFDYKITEKLKSSAQLLVAKRPENSFNKSLHWAYIAYDLSPALEIRVGRTGLNAFLVSDYRNVGYAQLWAHLPLEFYGQFSSDFGDGLTLIHKTSVAGGYLQTQAWLNKAKLFNFDNGVSEVEAEQNFGLSFNWEDNIWTYNATYFHLSLRSKGESVVALQNILSTYVSLWPELASIQSELTLDKTGADYYSLGVGYDHNNWIVRSEVSVFETEVSSINSIKNGYLLVGRRFGNVTPFVMGAIARNDHFILPQYKPNPLLDVPIINAIGEEIRQVAQTSANSLHQDQKTLSIGARWDIKSKLAIKAQWDRTWVGVYGANLLAQPMPNESNETINRFTISVDFMF